MTDLVDWGLRVGLIGTIGLAVRMAWKQFWRMLIFVAKPELYDRAIRDLEREQQDHDMERARRMEAEEENDHLRQRLAHSGDSHCTKPGGISSSTEMTDDLR